MFVSSNVVNCDLCEEGGSPNKVHADIESNNSVCESCKSRFRSLHRAPGGVMAYDQKDAMDLTVGVEKVLALKPGFIRGLPGTKFEVSSAAAPAAAAQIDPFFFCYAVESVVPSRCNPRLRPNDNITFRYRDTLFQTNSIYESIFHAAIRCTP